MESHAAVAWQQAPPEGDPAATLNCASSIEAAMNVPAEAAQLDQMVTDAFCGSRLCDEDPLHGHPRYQAVQDLSRCAAA